MSAATAPTSVYSAAAPGSATLPFPSASAKRSICTPSACSTISMLSVKSQTVRGLLHLLPHDVVEEEKIILKPRELREQLARFEHHFRGQSLVQM